MRKRIARRLVFFILISLVAFNLPRVLNYINKDKLNTLPSQPQSKDVEITVKEETQTETIEPNYKVNGRELPDNHSYSYRSDLESTMIKLLNDYRTSKGLEPLGVREDLRDSARYKSLSMLQLNYFAHENPNFPSKSFEHLIYDVFGYKHYLGIGENLGTMTSTHLKDDAIKEVFKGLQNSPGHNENMLRESFEYVGIGIIFSESPGSDFHKLPTIIVTQHFGTE